MTVLARSITALIFRESEVERTIAMEYECSRYTISEIRVVPRVDLQKYVS
jgi:hypothetical protein